MILMFHKVDLVAPTVWWVRPASFADQIYRLKGREFVHLDDYDPGNPRHVVITFDDAYENVHRHAFPLLREQRLPFEVFVIGDRIGDWNDFDASEPMTRFADLSHLQEMAAFGGRIQWHSRRHPDLTRLPDAALNEELELPAALREQFASPHFRWLAYPYGSRDDRVMAAARQQFSGAVAVEEPSQDRWQLGRVRATDGFRPD